MTRIKDLHSAWLKDPEYQQEYDALAGEFDLAHALIAARAQAGLTQGQLAERMDTSQSAVARMESGKVMPSVSFEPENPHPTPTHR